MRNENKRVTHCTLGDIADRVASGECDVGVLEHSMKCIQFMQFIISYGELHDFDLGIVVTAASNVPVAIADRLMSSGAYEEAFDVLDGSIEALQVGKRALMKQFNEQTDECGVPPIQ